MPRSIAHNIISYVREILEAIDIISSAQSSYTISEIDIKGDDIIKEYNAVDVK